MRFQVVAAVFAAIAAATVTEAATFPCPPQYGTCNTCTRLDNGVIASVTHTTCEFTSAECDRLYGDKEILCYVGCNCYCASGRMIQNRFCDPTSSYDKQKCIALYGAEPFEKGMRVYQCTDDGLASHFKMIAFPN